MTTRTTTNNNDRLLKPAEVAEMLSICPKKLWELMDSGQIPHLRVGNAVRYPASGIQDWIRQRVEESTSERAEKAANRKEQTRRRRASNPTSDFDTSTPF